MNVVKKKRKKGYSYFRIEVFELCSAFELFIGPDLNKINKKEKLVKDSFHDTQGYVNTRFINGWALMMLKEDSNIQPIVHECNHMINAIFTRIGQKLSSKNDEVQCHMLGHMCEIVENCLKWHNKKKK